MNNIFRNKSVERIRTPEQFNEYVKVSGKVSFVILIAIVIFIAGVVVWSVTGRMYTIEKCGVSVADGQLTGYIDEDKIGKTAVGSQIYVEDEKYTISYISDIPEILPESTAEYILHIGGLQNDAWVYEFHAKCSLPDGIYSASVVTEIIRPVDLVIN